MISSVSLINHNFALYLMLFMPYVTVTLCYVTIIFLIQCRMISGSKGVILDRGSCKNIFVNVVLD